MYASEPPTPREREISALRHRRNVVDDAIALERSFAWRRTRERLRRVAVTVARSA
jgi:hypothetical protein